MRLPSASVKLRTQPTWSLRSPPSMRLASTASCHWSWLLKSRSTAQTRSMGASMMVERTTFCSMGAAASGAVNDSARPRRWRFHRFSAQIALQGVEAGLEHALADRPHELALAAGGAFELRAPLREAACAVGDRRELQRRDVLLHAHRALE